MDNKYKHLINSSTEQLRNTLKSLKLSEINELLSVCTLMNNEKAIDVAFYTIENAFTVDKDMIRQYVDKENLLFILKNSVIKNRPYCFSHIMSSGNMNDLFNDYVNPHKKVSLMTFIVNTGKFGFLDSALANAKDKVEIANNIIFELIKNQSNFHEGFRATEYQNEINNIITRAFKHVKFSSESLPTIFKELLEGGFYQKRTWDREEFKSLVNHEIINSYSFSYEKAFNLFIQKYATEITSFNLDGYTSLTYLCKKYSEEAVIQFLENFSKNSDLVNKKDNFDKYPLNYYNLNELINAGATEKASNVWLLNFKKLLNVFTHKLLAKKVLKNTEDNSINNIEEAKEEQVQHDLYQASIQAQSEIVNNLNKMKEQFSGGVKTSINQVSIEVENLFMQTAALLDVYHKTPKHVYDSVEDIVFLKINVIKNVNQSVKHYLNTFETLKTLSTQDSLLSQKAAEMNELLLGNIQTLQEKVNMMQQKMIEQMTDISKQNLQTQNIKLKMLSQKN